MGESYELSYEIKDAIEGAYLSSWRHGSGPRVDYCSVDVYFHPNKAVVSGQITFYYITPNYSLQSDFNDAARRAKENIRAAIWNRIQDYADGHDDERVEGDWHLDLSGLKFSLKQEY